MITEYTPKSSKSLPIIGIYFNVNLIFVLISVILTIFVLNFHFRGPKKRRVPKFMRKYIIGYLGRLFCFGHESKAFGLIKDEYYDYKNPFITYDFGKSLNQNNIDFNANFEIIRKKSFIKSKSSVISNNFINKDSAHNLFTKNKNYNNHLIYLNNAPLVKIEKNSELTKINSLNEKNDQNSNINKNESNIINNNINNHIIITTPFYNKDNSNGLRSCKKSLSLFCKNDNKLKHDKNNTYKVYNSKKELLKNLESMIQKLERSFHPFELKDNNQKLLLLKEISECQLNILNSKKFFEKITKQENELNFFRKIKQKKLCYKKLTLNQIYDEWKIIAMIMDRTCFFLYLSFLLVSSVLFLISEQVQVYFLI